MIRVAIDAMGGDLGPRIAFQAAQKIIAASTDVEVLFYFDSVSFSPPSDINFDRIYLIPCSDHVPSNETIERSLFKRRDTSIYRAMSDHANGQADVVVTFGNTAAMVALARHIIGLLRPKLYPALIREMRPEPLKCLVDLGANVHCPAPMLTGFALLGSAYLEARCKDRANVALLNVGLETSKGSSVIKDCYQMLSTRKWPHFTGFAEGFELFDGGKNVIVCDGMVGNAVLKASEGLFAFLLDQLSKHSIDTSAIQNLVRAESRHGACLVGIKGNLVKGHGRSDLPAMIGAIEYGVDVARTNLHRKIEEKLLQQGVL
ncbi:fatty acid synthesis protein [Marinomonas piezotolerans]|uniref:Phosphate acyltransferase n=1 Tax=Marinomonas piezotolerans TaxID=2213058 RepID=A0A370UDP4_9GAMM|nr:fatty acid synthesis protein [Marinomonas piezotolerans]RDL45906.1 fatty acid synthesis protein [Marinomonas piezotolerans]